MITIWFESHGTTYDNEAKIASGWNNAKLSEVGVINAKDMAGRCKERKVELAFCSDLERAYITAQTALSKDPKKVFIDWRLRECNYGDFEHKPNELIAEERIKRTKTPFPNGESYEQCMERMGSFVKDLKAKFDGKTILIVGSRATHYGLEHCINEKWEWQPGWKYELK
jgi:broad specificity phosphatase PhoE